MYSEFLVSRFNLLLMVISVHRVVQQYAGVVPLMLHKNKTIFHGEV